MCDECCWLYLNIHLIFESTGGFYIPPVYISFYDAWYVCAPILVKTEYEGYIWLNPTFIYGSTLSPSPSLSIPSASRCGFTYVASHLKHQALIKADFLIHGMMVILIYTYLCLRVSDKNSIIVIISYFILVVFSFRYFTFFNFCFRKKYYKKLKTKKYKCPKKCQRMSTDYFASNIKDGSHKSWH